MSSKSIERSLRVRRGDCGLREPSSAAGAATGSGRSCGRSVATAGAAEVGDGWGGCDTGPLIVEDLIIGSSWLLYVVPCRLIRLKPIERSSFIF